MDIVIQSYKETEKRLSETSRSEVPVEVFHNTIGLCMDEDFGKIIFFFKMGSILLFSILIFYMKGVRIAYAQILSTFLDDVGLSKEYKEIESVQVKKEQLWQ